MGEIALALSVINGMILFYVYRVVPDSTYIVSIFVNNYVSKSFDYFVIINVLGG
ncbi:hypothetical protein GPUN_0923 [Glaciecola punicea ACAM 611]|uniref:Uncharacterized protein n=1 Tax=Glaciecola punicea ACAM 611 TaxID=1121923 RepID=H5T9S7_9ALTE|nr:hypothetical protein GPUN_0923 [Glaciecola punicea ACAM 611]